jgi:DNA-binding transcriptional ArsR family regulator
MLDALFDGGAWSVRELACVARISPSTASEHLAQLRDGGLVVATRSGRHCQYRLAGEDVALAIECLGILAPPLRNRGLTEASRNDALREGRTCYDHLAGRLGVTIARGFVDHGYLAGPDEGFLPTTSGKLALADVGIDVDALERGRRPIARACMDWSERRPHLAGSLGAALLARLESVGGLAHQQGSRAVRLRPSGTALLARLGIDLRAA